MKKAAICVVFAFHLFLSAAFGMIIYVPGDYPTIQEGINACSRGDTVMIAPGIYGGPGNGELNTAGNAMTIMGEKGALYTIIDCTITLTGFTISQQEDSNTVIKDLTIKNAFTGITCYMTSPIIRSCIFQDFFINGIYIDGYTGEPPVTPIIENCIFEQISPDFIAWGDGVYAYRATHVTVSGCAFINCGYGLDFHAYSGLRPDFEVSNCLFRHNATNAIWTHS